MMTQRPYPRSWVLICLIWALLAPLAGLAAAQSDPLQIPGLPGGQTAMQPAGDLARLTPKLNFDRVQPGQQVVVALIVDVQPGYHAQSHKPLDKNLIPFVLSDLVVTPGTVFEPIYPEGHLESYPALGEMSVYSGQAVIYIPLQVAEDATAGSSVTIRGKATFQICDDQSCFPPEDREFELSVPVVGAGESVTPTSEELFADFDPTTWSNLQVATSDAQAPVESVVAGDATVSLFGWEIDLAKSGIWLILPLAFIAGIIFNIVPCVLPVLPLKAMGFYEVAQHNRAKCLALGIAFSLGIALTFATLAVLVLVLRWFDWGQLFSQPWFALGIGIILIVMALYQFGVFEFAVPQSVYAITPRHDTYTGNVLFGILTAILSTPCTFGLFAGLLVWAVAQPAWIGVTTVTVTGIGMAFPYLVLSAFPEMARRFPRTGPWSELVKQAMGFLLLAIAAYFIRPLLPDAWRGPSFWWVIFGFIAAGGLYSIARAMQISKGRPRPILVTAALSAIVIVPLAMITYGLANPPAGWVYYSPEVLAEARASNKPVLVKFTADWCANCQTVEQTVFGSQEEMDAWRDKGLVLVKADLTKQDAAGWPLLRELHKVGSIPFTAIYLPGDDQPRKLPGIYGARDIEAALASGAQASR
jgi:thiol:disulfide interchange protein DsbD